MANTKSAEKRQRQNERRRMRNKAVRTRMRTAVKGVRGALAEGDSDKARELLPEAIRVIDVTRRKKVIHANTAARTKSRLTKAVQSPAETTGAPTKSSKTAKTAKAVKTTKAAKTTKEETAAEATS